MNWEPGVWREVKVNPENDEVEVPPKGTLCVVDFGDEFEEAIIRNSLFEDRDTPSRRYHMAVSDGGEGFTMPAVNYACDATDDGEEGIWFGGWMVDRIMILPA